MKYAHKCARILLLVFAGLVSDRARSFASGLARRLALAAVDFLVFRGRFDFVDGFNVFHVTIPLPFGSNLF